MVVYNLDGYCLSDEYLEIRLYKWFDVKYLFDNNVPLSDIGDDDTNLFKFPVLIIWLDFERLGTYWILVL